MQYIKYLISICFPDVLLTVKSDAVQNLPDQDDIKIWLKKNKRQDTTGIK